MCCLKVGIFLFIHVLGQTDLGLCVSSLNMTVHILPAFLKSMVLTFQNQFQFHLGSNLVTLAHETG